MFKQFMKSKFRCKIYHWAAKQQTSWVIAPWWLTGVSPWRICITFVWPRSSLKLAAPSSRLERHLHFASIILCLALLFIISIRTSQKRVWFRNMLIWFMRGKNHHPVLIVIKSLQWMEIWSYTSRRLMKGKNIQMSSLLNSGFSHNVGFKKFKNQCIQLKFEMTEGLEKRKK